MFKVLKGFILKNGFEGVVGSEVDESKFTPTELGSLQADGSLEPLTVGNTVANEGDAVPPASQDDQPQGNVDPDPSADESKADEGQAS